MYNDHMRTVNITEFKTHCLRLVDEMGRTREPINITKRGKPVAVLNPPPPAEVDWTPGAFKDSIKIVGDLDDFEVEWEAMR